MCLLFTNDWLRKKIASDADDDPSAGDPYGEISMTTKVSVSVNGNYKIPVKQGEVVTWVSGRGHAGPKEVDFWPSNHGDGTVFVIGPEEPDNG